jgi:hypothetical protein
MAQVFGIIQAEKVLGGATNTPSVGTTSEELHRCLVYPCLRRLAPVAAKLSRRPLSTSGLPGAKSTASMPAAAPAERRILPLVLRQIAPALPLGKRLTPTKFAPSGQSEPQSTKSTRSGGTRPIAPKSSPMWPRGQKQTTITSAPLPHDDGPNSPNSIAQGIVCGIGVLAPLPAPITPRTSSPSTKPRVAAATGVASLSARPITSITSYRSRVAAAMGRKTSLSPARPATSARATSYRGSGIHPPSRWLGGNP